MVIACSVFLHIQRDERENLVSTTSNEFTEESQENNDLSRIKIKFEFNFQDLEVWEMCEGGVFAEMPY